MTDHCTFKDYMKCEDDKRQSKTRKKLNKKDKKGRPTAVHGWTGYGPPPNLSGAPAGGGNGGGNGGGGAMGESYHGERKEELPNAYTSKKYKFSWSSKTPYEEEVEESKKQQARSMYQAFRQQGMSKEEMVNRFQQQLGLTPQSSTAYYERIAKEFGDTQQYAPTGMPGGAGAPPPGGFGGAAGAFPGGPIGGVGAEGEGLEGADDEAMELQDWESKNRQGTIRRVPGAHLVYKRQQDDGTFEELWVFKQGKDFQDAFEVRKDIIAGTDIPVEKTVSDDKKQKLDSWASGNMQMMSISGLPN